MPQQTDILARLNPGSRVLLLRLRSLGDCVLSTPSISLLKQHRSDLEVGVVVEPRFAPVYQNNPAVSSILDPTARAVRSFGPTFCINLHGGTRSARLTLLSGARFRAGFDIFRPSWIYNTPIPTAQEIMGLNRRVHTAEHMASAMFYLGVPFADVPQACLFPGEGRSTLAATSGPYAIFHAAAATSEKTWPEGFFVELARYVSGAMGVQPIFIGGPGEDLSPFQMWPTFSGAPLGEVAQLLRDASLFIGNDSGPAHMAAALGVPELVFFGPSDSEIWAPWKTRHQILRAQPIRNISVEDAIRALERLRVVLVKGEQALA